jgi:hypothetical protein
VRVEVGFEVPVVVLVGVGGRGGVPVVVGVEVRVGVEAGVLVEVGVAVRVISNGLWVEAILGFLFWLPNLLASPEVGLIAALRIPFHTSSKN